MVFVRFEVIEFIMLTGKRRGGNRRELRREKEHDSKKGCPNGAALNDVHFDFREILKKDVGAWIYMKKVKKKERMEEV